MIFISEPLKRDARYWRPSSSITVAYLHANPGAYPSSNRTAIPYFAIQ